VSFREIVGNELCSSLSRELIFTRNAFVTIQLAFHAILENTGRFGQQADDLEAPPGRTFLVPIG
jgi:hypothetical protein